MKLLYPIIAIIITTSVLTAQGHTGHCEHKCVIEKEEVGPIAKSSFYKKPSKFFSNGMQHFIGTTHQHSGYSDGFPGTTPADYYDSGIEKGFDFVMGADHSDFYNIPLTLHDECLSENFLDCISIDLTNPIGSIFKWPTFEDIAEDKTSNGSFVGVRGFEWTSDRFGHINVYFSKQITNAKTDGGYVLMPTFWNWLTTDPIEIPGLDLLFGGYGGGDALAVFNHPGDKSLFDTDPGFNWNNFEYVPEADSQMVGIEVFNDGRDYGADGRAFYQEALDAGWHVGAIASEDQHGTDWNNENDEKTIMVTDTLTTQGIKDAMYHRRTYAVRDFDLRMEYFAGQSFMGSQIQRKTGSFMRLKGSVTSRTDFFIEVIGSGNEVLGTFNSGNFEMDVEVTEAEKWYYIRVADNNDNRSIAYSSPIWIKGGGDVVENPATSISENNLSAQISIYPNPSNGNNLISIKSSENESIGGLQIISADGKSLKTDFTLQNKNTAMVNSAGLKPGVYFVKVQLLNSNQLAVKKLIVQ